MDLASINPELRTAAARLPAIPVDNGLVRWAIRNLMHLMKAPPVDGIALEESQLPGGIARLYRPVQAKSEAALLWIHRGGYLFGVAAQDHALCARTCLELGIPVLAVEYRKAPRHRHPVLLEDRQAGWHWLQQSAPALGIDPTRIAIGGQSAGAGLAASLVQRLRDQAEPQPVAQWLFCPMLDDRTAARKELDAIGHIVWSNRFNRAGWRGYLGQEPGSERVPVHAVPGRRSNLAGLPPAWIGLDDIDLFHDEDRDYATRHEQAGVPVHFQTVPGAPHGSESWAPDTAIAKSYVNDALAWLRQQLMPSWRR